MRDRVIAIRKELNMNQTQFAESINVSRNFINLFEHGNRDLSDRTIQDICRVHGINETWLRTGEGEMFAPATREAEIAAIIAKLFKEDDDSFRFRLIKLLAKADEEDLKLLEKIAQKIVNKEL